MLTTKRTGWVGWIAQSSEGSTLGSWVTDPLSVSPSVPTSQQSGSVPSAFAAVSYLTLWSSNMVKTLDMLESGYLQTVKTEQLCWDVGTLGNTLSRCITQDPRVGPSEACAIHPTWPLCLVACMNQAYCCACRLVHKWINEALRSLWAKPKSITSKCIGCMYVSWELLAAVAVIMFFQGWWCWVQLCVKVFLC